MNVPEIDNHKLPACFTGGNMGVQRCSAKCKISERCGFKRDHFVR